MSVKIKKTKKKKLIDNKKVSSKKRGKVIDLIRGAGFYEILSEKTFPKHLISIQSYNSKYKTTINLKDPIELITETLFLHCRMAGECDFKTQLTNYFKITVAEETII